MKKQLILSLVVLLAIVVGYFETELRTSFDRIRSDSASEHFVIDDVAQDEVGVADDGPIDPTASGGPPNLAGPVSSATVGTSRDGVTEGLDALRGGPAEEADERRQQFLRRLDAERGSSQGGSSQGSPAAGMAPPLLPGSMPEGPPPVLDGSGLQRLPNPSRDLVVPPPMGAPDADDLSDEFDDEVLGEEVDSIDVDDDVYLDDAPIDEYIDDGGDELPEIEDDVMNSDDGA